MQKKIILYFFTLIHLKFSQVFMRLYRIQRRKRLYYQTLSVPTRSMNGTWRALPFQKPFITENQTITFFGETEPLFIWQPKMQNKLWRYNLHYFNDLICIDSEKRHAIHSELISDWINKNKNIQEISWDPYVLSLRIVNWIQWFLTQNTVKKEWRDNLAGQINILTKSLEYDILGNHLFVNAKALIFGGIYFEGPQATKWLKKGIMLFKKQLKEQLLDDGGHFELTPMYHDIFIIDILDVINLTYTSQHPDLLQELDSLKSTTIKMLDWLKIMKHPDKKIPFFNDACFDISFSSAHILEYASLFNIKTQEYKKKSIIHLKNTGYIKLTYGEITGFLDVAELGPSYLMGHAHADTLSFELSFQDQRFLVNTGISNYGYSKNSQSSYGFSEERQKERSTHSHNTVVINNENSSEVWGAFRVARRAHPINLSIKSDTNSGDIECAHTGYERLSPGVIHHRRWQVSDRLIMITDTLTGSFKSAEGHLHFHPEVSLSLKSNHTVIATLKNGHEIDITVENADLYIENSKWNKSFNESLSNQKLILKFNSAIVKTSISFYT